MVPLEDGTTRRNDGIGVYTYTHRRLRELAGCDRGQAENGGGERF